MKTAFIRYVSVIIAVASLFSVAVIGVNASNGLSVKPFSDVAKNSWYEDSVLYCYSHGYITGTSQGQFSPNDSLTRAMAVQILYSVNGSRKEYSSNSFSDVSVSKWYHNAVEWAYENEIADGTGIRLFSPGTKITRQDFITMIYRYAQNFGHETDMELENSDTKTFSDNSTASGYAKEAIGWAARHGLISGYSDNSVRPKNEITRAEAAVVLCTFDGLFGHKWQENVVCSRTCEIDGNVNFTCLLCGEVRNVTTKAYHLWDDGAVTVTPRCLTSGTRKYTCTACAKTYTVSIPAIGKHVYGEWTVSIHATLCNTGTKMRYCKYCGISQGMIYRCDSYYQIQDRITLPYGGYDVSTANIGLKVIYINKIMLGTTSASYTSSTVNAVKRFQRNYGLPATGIVDLSTWRMMGYSESDWYNLGTYVTPMKVSWYSTRQDHINAMLNTAWEYANAGTVYRIGCSGAPGTYADCSGLIYQCLYSAGINPDTNIVDHALAEYEYTSRWLAADPKLGLSVPYSDLQPGDLVFYAANGRSTVVHVALYAGNGMIYDAWPNIGTTYRSVSIPEYYVIKAIRVFP